MVTTSRRPGFTLVELLVVIAIIGVLVALLFPAIASVRALAVKMACTSNMRQLYVGFEAFHENYKRYPPACKYAKGPSGNTMYEGWSWAVLLLPYIGGDETYDLLKPITNRVPWKEETDSKIEKRKDARETVIRELLCAARSGDTTYTGAIAKGFRLNESDNNIKGALTSYKGMGATVRESLGFKVLTASSTSGSGGSSNISSQTPPYGSASDHPDGVLFPAPEGIRRNDIVDGLSCTIMLAETIEEKYSRWAFGTEASLVGLPSEKDPAKCGVSIVKNKDYGHYAPANWDGKFDGDSQISDDVKTYLNYDYRPMDNKYDREADIKYGPSSRHAGVVNHLFCDGQVKSLSLETDVAAYMFMITRKGGESIKKWLADHE